MFRFFTKSKENVANNCYSAAYLLKQNKYSAITLRIFAAMSYSILQVRKGKEQSIFRKHPWIFSGALFTDTKEIEDG
ncbi:MAG: hypothetical protein EBR41_04265, partial [Crocinitomicaceae bacterium]|nr:hypothetical protein [Crocinitomicaceae bacterium]